MQADWAASRHGNSNAGPKGFLPDCAICHSPSNEVTAAGNMAVTCTACHTPGTPTLVSPTNHTAQTVAGSATISLCRNCHDSGHNAVRNAIGGKVSAGPHGLVGHQTGTCQRCHGAEGALAGFSAGWTGSHAFLIANQAAVWTPNAPATSTAGVVCSVCHDQHTGGMRAVNTYNGSTTVAWDPNGNAVADQYDTCTACHTLTDNTGALVGNYHNGGSINVTRTISDSHYDDPLTGVGLASNVVEGYVVRSAGNSPCADCHDVHSADVTVQEDWARSAHAGKIAVKKEEAACTESINWFNTTYPTNPASPVSSCTTTATVGTSTRTVIDFFGRSTTGVAFFTAQGAIDDADGNAWTHYNWDKSDDTVPGDRTGRKDCQRCHTATGASNFLNAPKTYNAANNSFTHLSGWSKTSGSPQQELLYCWGCHSSVETGALRNPGAITEVYAGTPTVTVSYPNLGPSNVCMACHLGREVGGNIAASTGNFANLSFINSHYLTAGSTLFNESGYEFTGQSYDSLGFHKNVGMSDSYGTGTDGPCVACHMNSANKHSFDVVDKDAGGMITAVKSNTCASCHSNMSATVLEEEKETFEAALAQLDLALQAKGIYFSAAYPYFYQSDLTTAFKNWDGVYPGKGKDVMGAAFNYNLFEHDPGAYAHNRQYALKLIADSIDFLDDGLVNQSAASASLASAAFGQMNIGNVDTSASPLHADAVANGSASYCGSCHAKGPHFGGVWLDGNDNPNNRAQFMGYSGQLGASAFSLTIDCSSCHAGGDIGANAQILDQYAESGHGDVSAIPWTVPEYGTSCQRCHTTIGFVNNLQGNAAAALDATQQANYKAAMQVITCNACHSDVNGGVLRPAPAFVATWSQNSVTATVTFPEAGGSNLCIRCHSARRAGPNLTDTATTTAHYLPVAAVVYSGTANLVNITATTTGGPTVGTKFTGVGYEFAGQDYSNLGFHKNIGTGDLFGTGNNGPCAACHMSGTAGHTWEPVSRDINGNFTAVNSAVCTNCHSDMTPTTLNAKQAEFRLALDELDSALQAKGFYFNEADGRFYQDAGFTTAVTTGATGYYATQATAFGLTARNLEGAAFNFWMFSYAGGDPAGFIHNRMYALKLIGDSVDYLSDGIVDGDTTVAGTQLATYSEPHAPVVASADENTCSQCHSNQPHFGGTPVTATGGTWSGTAWSGATYTNGVSQYMYQGQACANCHLPSYYKAEINKQYAESGHGNINGEAWTHYDWRQTAATVDVVGSSNRSSCVRCHTTTGYVARLGSETSTSLVFAAANADASKAPELLACNACHTDDDTGATRTPGQYTETYTDGGTFTFPDVGKSNLCLRCHSGRESGGTIKADTDADGVRSFINSHYLSAGGTLFTTTGYHFDMNGNSLADDYPNPPAYLHNVAGIATPGSPQPSDRGPCAECHMGNGDANHTWEPVAKDGTGTITAVTSTACATCHSGVFDITPALLNTAKAQYQASLAALDQALQQQGIYFYEANPYFYTAPYVVGGSNTSYTNWAGPYGFANYKNTMGAAFNLNLLEHDPGGFVHNSRYTRRLIRDAIDWIDNGVLDNSVPGTLTGLQGGGFITAQQLADAQSYLGATRP